MIIKEIDVYLNRNVDREHIRAVQGDSGRQVALNIKDAQIPAGAVATVYVDKPSGHAVYNMAAVSGNTITISLTAQMLAEIGASRCQVQVAASGEIITTFYLVIDVEEKLGVEAAESTDEMDIFNKAVEEAAEQFRTEAEAIADEVVDSIPEDYSTLSADVTDLKADLNYTTNVLLIGYKKIPGAFIASNGTITAVETYDLHCFQVSPGARIESIIDSGTIVYAFYTDVPQMGSVSYNNTRFISSYDIVENVNVPNTANWIAVRSPSGGTVSISPTSFVITDIKSSIASCSEKTDDINALYEHHFTFALNGWVGSTSPIIPTVNTAVNRFRTATYYHFYSGETISVKWSGLQLFPIYCDKNGISLGITAEWSDSLTFTKDSYCYLNFKHDSVSNFTNTYEMYGSFVHMTDSSKSIWNGKIWYSFGTSMSDINPDGVSGNNGTMGKWPLVVDELSGALRTNKAIGSGGIVPSAPHGGNVKANIMQCPYDVDLVTFECGLNDWGTIDLGTIGDKSNNTFIGNFTQCIEYLTYHTRAKIVFISMVPTTYTDYSTGTRRDVFFTNSYGKTYREYIDAMIKVCEYYGVEVIDAEGNAMSAGRRNKQTIRDTVHFTNLGGQIYGRYIWSKLKNILPMPVIPEALA